MTGVRQTASVLSAFSDLFGGSGKQGSLSYEWTRDLQIGSPYTEDITALQTALAFQDVYDGDITGGFYNQTFTAVKSFQQKYGINPTGYVGAITRAKLNTLY